MKTLMTWALSALFAATPAPLHAPAVTGAVQEAPLERRSPSPKSLPAPAPADHYAEGSWTRNT